MEKLIGFLGGDSQVGVTMLAQATVEYLRRQGMRALFITAGPGDGDDYTNGHLSMDMEEIYPYLETGSVTETDTDRLFPADRHVDILHVAEHDDFGKAELQIVYQEFAGQYDWIIVDCGWAMQTGFARTVVRTCHLLFVVITQQEKCMRRFGRRQAGLLSRAPETLFYVANKFTASGALSTIAEMQERLHCTETQLFRVDYVPYGWQAEQARETLLRYRRFRKGVKQIATRIAPQLQRRGRRDHASGRRLLRRIFSGLSLD